MTGDCAYAQSFDVITLLTVLSFTTLPVGGLLTCLIIVCVRNRRERLAHLALQGDDDDDSDEEGDNDDDNFLGNNDHNADEPENDNNIHADPAQPVN